MEFYSDYLLKKSLIVLDYKPDSPLLIHIALSKYVKGDYSEAIELLEKYLVKNPNNPCALILLSKAYAQLGKYQMAMQSLKEACEEIHSNLTFDFYLKEIEQIKNKEKLIFDSSVSSPAELSVEEDLNLTEGRVKDETISYDGMLVSETLAKIYVSQGEFREAVKIYEKLIERKPENKQKYLRAIEELNSRLKG